MGALGQRLVVWAIALLGWSCCFTIQTTMAAPETSLLMLGNSFTDANNLQEMVRTMLQEDYFSKEIYAMRFRQPGGQLHQDAENPAVQSTIAERAWTWVVLQEQSEIPGFYDMQNEHYQGSLKAVEILNTWIQEARADTVLLMTWGQRTQDSLNPILYKDFPTMQQRLAVGYKEMQTRVSTNDRPVPIAPAGLAFQGVYNAVLQTGQDPTADGTDFFNLYDSDGKHPSVEGSYLVACVLYATLSGRDPRRLAYKPKEMSTERKEALQEIASATMDQYNRDNAVNQQFLAKRPNKPESNSTGKKPYVPLSGSETATPSQNRRFLWFLFFAAASAMAMVVVQQRQSRKMDPTGYASSSSSLLYTPIDQHQQNNNNDDDMELVDIPNPPSPGALLRQTSV